MDTFSQHALVALLIAAELVSFSNAAPVPKQGLSPSPAGQEWHLLARALEKIHVPNFLQARCVKLDKLSLCSSIFRTISVGPFKLNLNRPPPNPKLLMLKTVKGNVHQKVKRRIVKRAAEKAFTFASLYSPQSKYYGVTVAVTFIAGVFKSYLRY